MQQKLNIFQLNIKLFNISGIIPSENINSSSWKSALFRIFQTLSILLFISMYILQVLALFHYWGNTKMVADGFCFLASCGAAFFVNSYTFIFWKNICDVTYTFETSSIFCSELVRSNQKHMKILNETLKLAQIYIKVIFIFEGTSSIFFALPTFMQHLMASGEEILQEIDTVEGFEKYFLFVIWLPPVLQQEFIIRVIYGLQFIYFLEVGLFTGTLCPFYTVLLLYTGTQFKLISSIVREMDEVMCSVENPSNIFHEVPKQPFTTDIKKPTDSFKSPISKKLSLKSNLDIEGPTERILISKMQLRCLQEDDINRRSERIHDPSSPEIKSTTKDDPETFYLMECIKLHQSSIK
jgi:hypothetical protein